MKLELYFGPAIVLVSVLIALANFLYEGGHTGPVVDHLSYGVVATAGN